MEKEKKIYDYKKKSIALGVLLNLLLVGAGSMYAGKVGKGIVLLFGSIFIFFLSAIFLFIPWIVYLSFVLVIGILDVMEYNEILKMEMDL